MSEIKEAISYKDFQQIKPGDIIYYLLPLSEIPTNPYREWKGKVIIIQPEADFVRVSSLMPELEGEEENVKYPQVVRWEKQNLSE